MSQQSDKMRASVTSFEFCNKEEEKKETDKELSDDDNSNN
jgi:hypothetical protein